MEKRRWFCRRYCMPGDSCPGSSPLSVGEKVLDSGWGSLSRGRSCRPESERHQPPSLPLPRHRGGEETSLCPSRTKASPGASRAVCHGVSGRVGRGGGGMPGGEGRGKGPRPLTLVAPVVELVELLCELGQGLLDGLGAGH